MTLEKLHLGKRGAASPSSLGKTSLSAKFPQVDKKLHRHFPVAYATNSPTH